MSLSKLRKRRKARPAESAPELSDDERNRLIEEAASRMSESPEAFASRIGSFIKSTPGISPDEALSQLWGMSRTAEGRIYINKWAAAQAPPAQTQEEESEVAEVESIESRRGARKGGSSKKSAAKAPAPAKGGGAAAGGASVKGSRKRATQLHLDESFKPETIPEIERAALDYVEKRDERMRLLAEEVDAREILMKAMKAHKKKNYKFDGFEVNIKAEEVEKITVRTVKSDIEKLDL